MIFTAARRANTLSGIWFVAVFALSAIYISEIPWVERLGFSSLVIAIVIGMLYGNTLRQQLPEEWVPGIQFSAKVLLRWGVALFGFRVTFQQIVAVGLQGLVIDVINIALTFFVAWLVGTKIFKLDRDSSILIGSGAAICGAAAVLATEGVTRSEPHKTSVAVATVILFGTASMFIDPLLYHAGVYHLMNLNQIGLYVGSTIHEVAQVVVAGNAISVAPVTGVSDFDLSQINVIPGTALAILPASISSEDVATAAVIVKMTRVLLLAPTLIILGFFLARGQAAAGQARQKIVIPWFAVWFIIVIAFNSLNVLPVQWVPVINQVDTFLLTMAMGALGIETYWGKLKGVGVKGVLLGAFLTLFLMIGGYFITLFITQVIH